MNRARRSLGGASAVTSTEAPSLSQSQAEQNGSRARSGRSANGPGQLSRESAAQSIIHRKTVVIGVDSESAAQSIIHRKTVVIQVESAAQPIIHRKTVVIRVEVGVRSDQSRWHPLLRVRSA